MTCASLRATQAHCIVLEYGEESLADFLKRGALQRNERRAKHLE